MRDAAVAQLANDEMATALQVENLSVSFGQKSVLNGITFELPIGVHALVGSNASGKSTLLNALAGAHRLGVTGQASLSGADLLTRSGRKGRIAFLPQRSEFPKRTTVQECLDYAAWLYRVPKAERRARSRSIATRFQLHPEARVSELSGGTIARVALAQIWVSSTPLTLLDEPVAGIDTEFRELIRQEVSERGKESVVLMATHHHGDIAKICDQVLVMDKGRLVHQGDSGSFLERGDGDVEAAMHNVLATRRS